MKKTFVVTALAVCAMALYGKPIFIASLDKSGDADAATGIPVCRNMTAAESAKLLVPGRFGKAAKLHNNQRFRYFLEDNFNTAEGTISVWMAPGNWSFSQPFYQTFVEVYQGSLWILVYKYEWSDNIMFLLRITGDKGKYTSYKCVVPVKSADWKTGQWRKIDAVWNTSEMALYIDGKLPKSYKWMKTSIKLPKGIVIPAASRSGSLTLGGALNFNTSKNPKYSADHFTLYDNLKIYDRPLSAAEILESYKKDCKVK